MAEHFRGFTDVFRGHMARHSGWPSDRDTLAWFHREYDGMQKGAYARLKRGELLAEHYTAGVVRLMLDPPGLEEKSWKTANRAKGVLLDFLRPRGIHSPGKKDLASVLSLVCTMVDERTDERQQDWVTWGITTMLRLLYSESSIIGSVLGCGTREHTVKQAIDLMYDSCGRQVAARLAKDRRTAIEAAELHLGQRLADYQSRAQDWHRFNPWTVIYAHDHGTPVGMTIVLPVSDEAYSDVFEGRRASYELTPDDFAVPTCNLIIEAGAERPGDVDYTPRNPTKALILALIAQTAALARVADLPREKNMRALTFAGTPTNRERLLASGFRTTGRTMARSGVELIERRFPLKTLQMRDLLNAAVLQQLSHVGDTPPPPSRRS